MRVDGVDDVELAGQPLRGETTGDLQPGRVVGEDDVLVTELQRGERHLLDRRAAVGPVRVGVQVAAQAFQALYLLFQKPRLSQLLTSAIG